MKLAIVAYPRVSSADRCWIEEFRQANDPQSGLIAAHFTLVFPAHVRVDELVEHARPILSELHNISFVLERAQAVPSVAGQGAHVFLVPGQGATEIVRLHDRLYSGFLEPHLRADIPFIPHVTVGAHRDVGECERLATILNGQRRAIAGKLTGVDIVQGEGEARSLAHLSFADDSD